MSKAAAVHIAVTTQIAADAKAAIGMTDRLGPNEVPAANVTQPYDATTIRGFLANVALRLRGDAPPLVFKWATLDTKTCLSSMRWVLEADIANATLDAVPETPPSAK